MEAVIKRTLQPTIQDYKISSQILQAAIKRNQVQPLYNKYVKASRIGYDMQSLKEMSKPYLLKDLRNAWRTALYEMTIYKKPLNKLNKAELYHELLNVNHNFSQLPKKQPRGRKK